MTSPMHGFETNWVGILFAIHFNFPPETGLLLKEMIHKDSSKDLVDKVVKVHFQHVVIHKAFARRF